MYYGLVMLITIMIFIYDRCLVSRFSYFVFQLIAVIRVRSTTE